MTLLLHLVASVVLALVLRCLSPGRVPVGALGFLLSPPGLGAAIWEPAPRAILAAVLALAALWVWLADLEAPAGGSAAYYGAGGVITGLLVTVGPVAGPSAYLGAMVLDPVTLPLPILMALSPSRPGRRPRDAASRGSAGRLAVRLAGYGVALAAFWLLVVAGQVPHPAVQVGGRAVLGMALLGPVVDPTSVVARAAGVIVAVAAGGAILTGRGGQAAAVAATGAFLFALAAGVLQGSTYLAAAMLWSMLGALALGARRGPAR